MGGRASPRAGSGRRIPILMGTRLLSQPRTEVPIPSTVVPLNRWRFPRSIGRPKDLLSNPLHQALDDAQSILVSGAGGGFDIYSGLPLYLALRKIGKTVHLANYSFAHLPETPEAQITPDCVRVHADIGGSDTFYFPERRPMRMVSGRTSFGRGGRLRLPPLHGVRPLREAYEKLRGLLKLDAIVLVDGGSDSLLRGDESELGTPVEDMTSLAAVHGLDIPCKLLTCLGFGVDYFHGVCHANCLEAIAALTRRHAFLGVTCLLPQMPEAEALLSAVDYANERTPRRASIVSNSIASAVEGRFGDHHRSARTRGTKLWINPLMNIYWTFELRAVMERCLYASDLENTFTQGDVIERIRTFRARVETRLWDDIPL